MTHDILRSDIELASRLLDDKRSDEEIITALVHRGVDSAKAAELVVVLRGGGKANAKSALPLEFGLGRRSRSRSVSLGPKPGQPSPSAKPESRRESPRRAVAHDRKKSKTTWLFPALLFALVVVVGGILVLLRYRAGTDATEEPPAKAPTPKTSGATGAAPAKASAPAGQPSTASLALELQPDGLHIAGSHVTGGNVLAAVASSLGAATRTNRVGQTDTVIYAYDQQGLLVYVHPAGGTNSVMLDCEANGGIHGTTSPFTGTLTVEGLVIRADTDPETLTAIKQLGLNRPGSHTGIWGGRYNDLQLVFAYLKSPRRLSLIEVDLK